MDSSHMEVQKDNSFEEDLNLLSMYKRFFLAAINRYDTLDQAAKMLGISERTASRWKVEFNVCYDRVKKCYVYPVRPQKRKANYFRHTTPIIN